MATGDGGRPSTPIVRPGGMAIVPGRGSIESKYNEAEFIVGGKGAGKKGDLEKIDFKIHEGYLDEALKWINSKRFPYAYLSDLIRHAVVRHLKWLPTVEGEVEGSLLHELAQIDEDQARRKFQLMFIKHIESINETVNETLQLPGGQQEVGRMLRKYRKQIESTRHTFFKTVYEKMFNDRFGIYLQQSPMLAIGGKDGGGAGDGDDVVDMSNVYSFELPSILESE